MITRAEDEIESKFTVGWEIIEIARWCSSLTHGQSALVNTHGIRVLNKQIVLLQVYLLLITYLRSGINLHHSHSRSEPTPRPDDLKNHDINIEVLDRSQERVEISTRIQKRDWEKSVTVLNC